MTRFRSSGAEATKLYNSIMMPTGNIKHFMNSLKVTFTQSGIDGIFPCLGKARLHTFICVKIYVYTSFCTCQTMSPWKLYPACPCMHSRCQTNPPRLEDTDTACRSHGQHRSPCQAQNKNDFLQAAISPTAADPLPYKHGQLNGVRK